ncbi:YfiT family bacillithiol transferase [Paenibacillus sp. L3-i20]|uniref:YfiT family bacillithiol transferase n=1 Tax=Paenibacillus sp. L3-i20 TaxID=2905833 RepID=UPI001EE0BDF6|nr:bacillithiol transferase BstA [Paenibacillus sp. L3-i20]GKU79159.1 putative metal-dependent hydrolase YfiT [Paenibacillus sp. L3-i20]
MDIRFPIGTFDYNSVIDLEQRKLWIDQIAELPTKLIEAVVGLTEEQLRTPYREGGWNIKQVIHHIADSHMNSYIRFKLALTEQNPTIRPYFEDRWAELSDTFDEPIETSLKLLEVLHRRWVTLLTTMTDEQFERTFFHPESKEIISLNTNLGVYCWHGRHHLAHITSLRERLGW